MLPPMASEAPKERRYWAGARLAPAAPALLTLLVAIAIIASGRGGPSEATDQDIYHLVVIRGMVDQWPAIDVVNYPSATSPGYHALMTLVAVATPGEGSDLLAMRLATALLGALVPALAGLLAARWVGPWVAAALAAPLAVNSYVLGGAAYLTTDNLAYALILATLAAALARPAPAAGVAGGLAAAALVAVRQVHVWVVAPLGLAALLASPLARRLPGKWRFEATRWSPLAAATVGVTLALGVLGAFVAAWGGLTPPSDAAAKHAMGPNPASPAMALAMFAIAAIPLAWAALPELRRGSLRWTLAGGAIGLASALATPTSFELKRRAYGWVWTVVRETPAPADRSLALALLAGAGGAALGLLASAAARRGRGVETLVVLAAMAGWVAAQSMNAMAWQRYFGPLALIFAMLLVALVIAGESRRARPGWRGWWLGPAALIALQLAVSALTLLREVAAGERLPAM